MASYSNPYFTPAPKKVYQTPAPKPVYQTPAPKPVYSTPANAIGMSTNQGPVYSSGDVGGYRSVSTGQPVTLPSYTPTTYNYPTVTQNNATTDFANLLKGLTASLNPLTNLTSGAGLNATKNFVSGAIGSLGTVGTQAIKAVAPLQYSALQNLTKESNPFEFNLSEAIAGIGNKINKPVIANEPSYNLKVTPTPTAIPDSSYKAAQDIKQRMIDINSGKITPPPSGAVNLDSINALLTDPNIVAVNKQAEALQKVTDLKQQLDNKKISLADYNKQVYELLVGPTPAVGTDISTGTNNSTGTKYSPELQAVVDNIKSLEQTQSTKYNQLVNEINSGAKSEQDAATEWAKTQKDIENAKYDALNNALKSQIPLIESNYTSSYNQDTAQKQAAIDAINKQKELNKITTGENIKASVSNQKSEEARLRNVFSNLGTADSTYFVDALTKATQEGGQNQNAIERQGMANEATYNTNATTTTNTYDKLLADLLLGKNTDIANVNNQINTNEANRTSDLGTVLQNLANMISTSNSNATSNKVKTYAQQIADANGYDNLITNYQLNDLAAKKQSDYSTQVIKGQQDKINNGLIINSGTHQYARPQGFSSDLWAAANKLVAQGLRG